MDNLTERLLDPKTVEARLAQIELGEDESPYTYLQECKAAIRELHRLLATAKAEGAAARADVDRMDKVQGHLANLCAERLDKILELERQLVNEKSAHAWTEVREQSAIDAARSGDGR